jgi:predicted regulator of Ras-like GTPase activity (Roadblock/LC7/MglB family)
MHWLEEQVARLTALAEAHARNERARAEFMTAVREVAGEVAGRDGVTACFVCHDGLLIDTAGRAPDFEALSAMTQSWMVAGKEAATTLALGRVQQMVLVGGDHKLALFVIGQLAVGILSPSTVNLAKTLSQ